MHTLIGAATVFRPPNLIDLRRIDKNESCRSLLHLPFATNGWSIEGVAIALRHQFPDFTTIVSANVADRRRRIQVSRRAAGLASGTEHCKVVKPSLNRAIYSSGHPRCRTAGRRAHAAGQRRRARLGVVTAFAPAALVPPAIKLRCKIVGGGRHRRKFSRSKHGCTFPSTLRRCVNPPLASWLHWLLKRRDEYAVFPLYHEHPTTTPRASGVKVCARCSEHEPTRANKRSNGSRQAPPGGKRARLLHARRVGRRDDDFERWCRSGAPNRCVRHLSSSCASCCCGGRMPLVGGVKFATTDGV